MCNCIEIVTTLFKLTVFGMRAFVQTNWQLLVCYSREKNVCNSVLYPPREQEICTMCRRIHCIIETFYDACRFLIHPHWQDLPMRVTKSFSACTTMITKAALVIYNLCRRDSLCNICKAPIRILGLLHSPQLLPSIYEQTGLPGLMYGTLSWGISDLFLGPCGKCCCLQIGFLH